MARVRTAIIASPELAGKKVEKHTKHRTYYER